MQECRNSESTGSYQIQNFKINWEEIRNGLSLGTLKSSHKIKDQIHKQYKKKGAIINTQLNHEHQHKWTPVKHESCKGFMHDSQEWSESSTLFLHGERLRPSTHPTLWQKPSRKRLRQAIEFPDQVPRRENPGFTQGRCSWLWHHTHPLVMKLVTRKQDSVREWLTRWDTWSISWVALSGGVEGWKLCKREHAPTT